MMLEITGDTSLYNYNMLRILLSLPGIAAIVLILCLSALLAYFEFSVILTGLYQGYRGKSFSLKDTVGSSVYSLFSLNFKSIPGLFILWDPSPPFSEYLSHSLSNAPSNTRSSVCRKGGMEILF